MEEETTVSYLRKPHVFSIVATKRPTVLYTSPVSTQQQIGPSNVIDFFADEFPPVLDEELDQEIYEPTPEDQLYMDEVLAEQYERETAAERFAQQAYEDEMKCVEEKMKAESILERAGEVLEGIRYVHFVSRSKGRYHSGNKKGQRIARRNWVEVELISRGVEPNRFIDGFRRRVYWPASKFPWDECADERGMSEADFMSIVPILAQNSKQARRYLDRGARPDYRKLSLVGY